MPIPQITRIDPLDLQKNIAIGISLPFNSPSVFRSNYSTKDQIKSNLINLVLTNRGERIMNPLFGCDIKNMVFEGMSDSNIPIIKDKIASAVGLFIPQVQINEIDVKYQQEYYNIDIIIKYNIILSGTADQVIVQFQ